MRAALDLVDAVQALGPRSAGRRCKPGRGAHRGRGGHVGAKVEGMVAGDLVNTASRIQSEAEPGTVLVGDFTREATEAAIVYQDPASKHSRERPNRSALACTARRCSGGGRAEAEGLEAPSSAATASCA